MSFLRRFFFLFFVCLLFLFLSQSYLFADQEQLTLEQELSKAKSKSATGLILAITGSVLLAGSMILIFADPEEIVDVEMGTWTYVTVRSKKTKGIYFVGGILGLLVGGTGLAIHLPAKNEVKRLEKERGLTTQVRLGMLPEYRAMGMKITISW